MVDYEDQPLVVSDSVRFAGKVFGICLLIGLIMLICGVARAENIAGYTENEWADAILKAEGNANYGVLKTYKHTTPRQACINTVKHRWRAYLKNKSLKKEPFLAFLGATYAPVKGANNDPRHLNRNWQKNVYYWLIKNRRST